MLFVHDHTSLALSPSLQGASRAQLLMPPSLRHKNTNEDKTEDKSPRDTEPGKTDHTERISPA
jgi:hypothetical protein